MYCNWSLSFGKVPYELTAIRAGSANLGSKAKVGQGRLDWMDLIARQLKLNSLKQLRVFISK